MVEDEVMKVSGQTGGQEGKEGEREGGRGCTRKTIKGR